MGHQVGSTIRGNSELAVDDGASSFYFLGLVGCGGWFEQVNMVMTH